MQEFLNGEYLDLLKSCFRKIKKKKREICEMISKYYTYYRFNEKAKEEINANAFVLYIYNLNNSFTSIMVLK